MYLCCGCNLSSTDKANNTSETVRVSAEDVLAQREKDLNSFTLRKQQIDTLIKMIAKVTESIVGKYNSVSTAKPNWIAQY